MESDKNKMVIVTGYSGAGKSSVLKALEDSGFFCIDNLPVDLLHSFFSMLQKPTLSQHSIALCLDIRGGKQMQSVIVQIQEYLSKGTTPVYICFVLCAEQTLIKRFQETRRTHPLINNQGLINAIKQERELLKPLIPLADMVVDTSQLSINELRQYILRSFCADIKPQMVVNLMSFGFKYGIPIESNYIFDLRSLPNPYYQKSLRPLDGTTQEIQNYLFDQQEVQCYWSKITDFIDFSIERAFQEGRYFITISIGCTGGRHRSVAFVERISNKAFSQGNFIIHHRDKEKSTKRS